MVSMKLPTNQILEISGMEKMKKSANNNYYCYWASLLANTWGEAKLTHLFKEATNNTIFEEYGMR